MTKQIRTIMIGEGPDHVARVELTMTIDFLFRAKAVVERQDPQLSYETAFYTDEREALSDIARWLRSLPRPRRGVPI